MASATAETGTADAAKAEVAKIVKAATGGDFASTMKMSGGLPTITIEAVSAAKEPAAAKAAKAEAAPASAAKADKKEKGAKDKKAAPKAEAKEEAEPAAE